MPTGHFREPVSSSPVSLMGSRRLFSGSGLVLPPEFPAFPGCARESSAPSPPSAQGSLSACAKARTRCGGAPGPPATGHRSPRPTAGEDSPLAAPDGPSPTCLFNRFPLSPTNLKNTHTEFHFRVKRFPFPGGVPGKASSPSRPGWKTYQRVEERSFSRRPFVVLVSIQFVWF